MGLGTVGTLVSLALSAAGTGASIAGAQESKRKMNETLNQALARQDQFQRQATPVFEESLAQSTPQRAQQQIGEGEQTARNLYQQLQGVPFGLASNPIPQDSLTVNRTNKQIQAANEAQAGLQGYGNMSFQQWLKNQEAARRLGFIGGQAQSANSILSYQLQGAQHSGDSLAGLGSLMSTAGSLAGIYGATRPAAPATSKTQPAGKIT